MPWKNPFKKSSRTDSDKSELLDPAVVNNDQDHSSECVSSDQQTDTVHNEPSAERNPSVHVGDTGSQPHIDPAITQPLDESGQQLLDSLEVRENNNKGLCTSFFDNFCCCVALRNRAESTTPYEPI